MEEMLTGLIQYLQELAKNPDNFIFLYGILFISAVIENLFPPIPGDTITAFGAFLVGTGTLDYFYVYLSTSIGSVIGFMCLFFVGKYLQREFFVNKNFKFFSVESIENAENWFSKYGYYIVLANRFFPGIRSVISIVSGISKLNTLKVFILALISASVWNLIWIHAGYVLGDNWDVFSKKITGIIKNYNMAVGGIIAIGLIGFIVYRYIKRKKENGASE